jgi:hypothetical protein
MFLQETMSLSFLHIKVTHLQELLKSFQFSLMENVAETARATSRNA